jgi:hypothetical protein
MSNLYFGPYNDPGDTQTPPLHHWEPNHDADCHNAAFTVDRVGQVLTVTLAVRNRGTEPSPSDLVVTLYAAACGLFGAVTDVNGLVQRIMLNGSPDSSVNPDGVSTHVHEWGPSTGTTPAVAPFNATLDNAWFSSGVQWVVPAYSSSFILVATLFTAAGMQQPIGVYAQDPCVAIWLG